MSKPFTVYTVPQGSVEWKQLRAGMFTASRADDAFATTKKGDFTAERKNLRSELALARLTGKPKEEGYQSKAMRDGMAREAGAIRAYENIHGVIVRSCGFVRDNDAPIGCSPDGVIGDFEGLVQAKCPLQATHLASLQMMRRSRSEEVVTVRGNLFRTTTLVVPDEYLWQICHELYVTGASWCDYFSYHADFPEPLRAVTIRVTREDVDLAEYAHQVRTFLDEVDAEHALILELMS